MICRRAIGIANQQMVRAAPIRLSRQASGPLVAEALHCALCHGSLMWDLDGARFAHMTMQRPHGRPQQINLCVPSQNNS